MAKYKDPILSVYLDLIEDNRDDIKTFEVGDPIEINLDTTSLPAVYISYDTQELNEESSMTDEHRISVTLTVVTDIRDSWDGAGNAIIEATKKLSEIVAGRKDDYTLDENSILYLLRNNLNMGNGLHTDVASTTVANFGVAPRPVEEFATQANIQFEVYFSQGR